MGLNYTFLSVIDTVALIQGITLGTLLMLLNRRKYCPTFYLGVFIFMFTLEKLPLILSDIGFLEQNALFYLLPLNHTWLLFPLFYLYCQKVSIFSVEKASYWALYPGTAIFLFQAIIFFLPTEIKFQISGSLWYKSIFALGNVYAIYIAYKCLKYINTHIKEVGNHFSSLEYKELKWAKTFVLFGILFYLSALIALPFKDNSGIIRILFTVVNFLTIYWLSFHGTMQYNVERILSNPDRYGLSLKPIVNDESFLSSEDEQKNLVKKINAYISKSEVFIHNELTIIDLGNNIGVHPRRISSAINSVLNQNFNTYINQFRIKKAMLLLQQQERLDLNIEGIGTEVGFKSKSAFYSAFKKETGSTPTRYREKTDWPQ